jgi:hypothetical protein
MRGDLVFLGKSSHTLLCGDVVGKDFMSFIPMGCSIIASWKALNLCAGLTSSRKKEFWKPTSKIWRGLYVYPMGKHKGRVIRKSMVRSADILISWSVSSPWEIKAESSSFLTNWQTC